MKEKIISIIKEIRGHKMAKTSGEILNRLAFQVKDVELRSLISEAVCDDKALIGSCEAGFFWITDKEDLRIAKSNIEHRIAPLRKRALALDFNWYIAQQVQPELFEERKI
jgi:hypothetical protein